MNIQLKAKRQDGFTIIELVVVILLLGILAATALPRFLDVTDEAHEAVNEGVVGGLNSGSALFRASWVATGQSTDAAVDAYSDGLLFANADGYPIGLDATIDANTCAEVFDNLLQSGHPNVEEGTVAQADFGTVANIETEIEAEAASHTDADYIAILEQAVDIADSTTCHYYYVGQYRSGESGDGARTIQEITYNITTGAVGTTTFNLTVDAP